MTDKLIQQFRSAVYQSLLKRADAVLDLIDALTVAGHVESPVTVSEQTPFRRKFSMVYDTLANAAFDFDALLHVLLTFQPADSETIAGYEIYGLDATKDERPDAETLPERCSLKSQKDEPLVYGHKYSWLVRLVRWGTSWVAPQDMIRIDPELSDSQVGSQQVKALAERSSNPKVVVADSLYGNHVFLAVFRFIQNAFALVRLRSNNVLYEQPVPRKPGQRGAPKKHGARFKLSSPARPADRAESFLLGLQTVRIQAWQGLHLKKLPELVVMVLQVEFLRPDGKPRYKQPMWLLWTGPTSVPLPELCQMYLWRFAIEHMFRFLKQNIGLSTSRSNHLVATEQWKWMCGLAYWQLLLMRNLVEDACPAWYPRFRHGKPKELTPGQVQRAALRYLLQLGTPARAPKVAGKGKGRLKGYRPAPRARYPVVKKAKTGQKQAAVSP
ncbi:MAG TPA: transposase [Planococcus sp. (in: firmicutes)]|nr:transposase [Planococcus sp. (in: firmicutes)]